MKPLAAVLVWVAFQQSCIERLAGPPEQIAEDAAREFRPYFPRVQVHADPQNQVIIVATCSQGLGLPFFQTIEPKVAVQLENNSKLQQLRMAGIAEAFGQRIPYNQLIVLFEDRMLVWRRMGGPVMRYPNPPALLKLYREGCSEGFTSQPKTPVSAPAHEPSILGHDPQECRALAGALEEVKLPSTRALLEELQRKHLCADARSTIGVKPAARTDEDPGPPVIRRVPAE